MNNKRIQMVQTLVALTLIAPWFPIGRADAAPEGNITLNVPKANVRDALRLVAEHGGLNLTVGPEVDGEVSVYLTNATIETALEAIARNADLEYSVSDGIVSVKKKPERIPLNELPPPPVETRVFTLRAADAARVRDALVYALTPYGKMGVYNDNSGDRYSTLSLSQLEGDVGESGTRGQPLSSTTAGGQTSQNGGATITQSNAQNARRLVVTDTPENLDRIADLVATLDTLPPQVLIEARIVEMSTDLQRQMGIDWDINVLANGPVLNHELPLHMEAGFASGDQIRRTANGTANSSVGLSLGTVDFSRLMGMLRIHASDNAIRLLANPRLLVFNNHSASILVGERYPLLESNVSEFGIVTESLDTYIPVGVQLEVQPTIMLDGRVSMMIHPVTSALGDDVVGTTGIRVARIRTRELSTRVIMGDGETIALGGLISDRKTRNVNKIPGLGDLPGLSALFRQENPASERIDLIVFVTARVEGATVLSDRDREVFESYEPNFKEVQKLQDVQLHHEIPSEYQKPKPMYGDPVVVPTSDVSRLRGFDGGYEPMPSEDIEKIQRQAPPASRPPEERLRIAGEAPSKELRGRMIQRRRDELRRTAAAGDREE
ncbi:MAG: hypothetical protein KDA33_10025 [Phycisphaerales bacterium]|nr:hypothetical protein [Phycisphaerales bacterium]